MLNFKSFLLEGPEERLNFLKEKHKDGIDTSHDTSAKHFHVPQIIDHIAEHDPSPKKTNTQWMVDQYRKKNYLMKDLPKIKSNLEHFEKHKPKLANKDIGSYKTPHHLRDAIMPHTGVDTGHGSYMIHNNNGLTVHRIETYEGACHHGTDSDWCTSKNTTTGLGHFNHYNAKGPLYVVHDRNSGGKYQFHFENDEFRNQKDQTVPLPHVVNQIPELKNVQEFKNHPSKHGVEFEHPHETHQRVDKNLDKLFKMHPDTRKQYMPYISDMQTAMDSGNPDIHKKIMAHYDTHIKDHHDAYHAERELIHSPHVTVDQKAHIFRTTKFMSTKSHAIKYAPPHEKHEYVNSVIDQLAAVKKNNKSSYDHSVGIARFVDAHGDDEHVDRMVSKYHHIIHTSTVSALSRRITSATAHKVFKETGADSIKADLLHSHHTPDMVKMGLKDVSADTRIHAARKASEEQLHGMVKKEKNIEVLESITHHAPKSVLDKLVKHENPFVRQSVAIHSKYKEHLDALANDPDKIVSDTVTRIKAQRKKYKME